MVKLMPQLESLDLTILPDYKSVHRDKLESRYWKYVGSMEHMLEIDGRPVVRWKHYWSKGRKLCVTTEALKVEGIVPSRGKGRNA